ncbi:unnamed protein product [Paramecium octaurelia]|uniref:CDP-diacylglycerol--inositol 3-phosphatidyltransferase n=1 Tax=Paramecium octaurelia TaxID=43137 RepID=A0A8S1T2A8_PAROT|nr:unnamed protein product [Paramecium octaurelia]
MSVYFYIPNLIGYARVVCALVFCYTGSFDPIVSAVAYSVSQLGDLFDGMAARKFKQCSVFGSVLDMVTDRFSNACLLAVLYKLYPTIGFLFLWALALDLCSHWYQMYSTLYCNEKHHKTAVSKYKILEIYYKVPYMLFVMVLLSETAMVTLYLNVFIDWFFIQALMYVSVPFLCLKHYINFIQLMSASDKIIEKESNKI